MNKQCEQEVKQCNSLNEIFTVLNKYYDLDKSLGIISGPLVKSQILKNVDQVIKVIGIQERTQSKRQMI